MVSNCNVAMEKKSQYLARMNRPIAAAFLIFAIMQLLTIYFLPQVPEYIHEEENQSAVPITSEESDAVENYTYSEPPQQVVSQSDNWGDEPLPEEPISSFTNGMAMAPEEPVQSPPVPPPHVEEPVGEPVKKTYASIVCCTFTWLIMIIFLFVMSSHAYLKP